MGIARGVNSGQKRALAKVGSREPLLPFSPPPLPPPRRVLGREGRRAAVPHSGWGGGGEPEASHKVLVPEKR